ncbi:MAG: glycosyltransferase [Actinomycetota bacterium]
MPNKGGILRLDMDPMERHIASRDALLNLPFDHFGRYMLTRESLDILWAGDSTRHQVLDIGGSSSSIKHFLPNHDVTLADLKEPPPFTHRAELPFLYDRYLVAAGGALPFPDETFDLVTAHDTLEHVPDEGRLAFLEDMLRLSRRFIILNGPMFHEQTAAAEARLGEFWKKAMAWEKHPLDEHIDNGLPKDGLVEDFFRSAGCTFAKIPNGNLQLWTTMFAFKSYLLALKDSGLIDRTLDRAYNQFIYPKDVGGLCYRTAYVIAKDPADVPFIEAVRNRYEPLVAAKDLEKPADLDIEGVVQGLEDHVVALNESVKTRAKHEADFWHMQSVLSEKDRVIRVLQGELEGVRSAAGYRLVNEVWTMVKRYVPDGTLRHRVYKRLKRLLKAVIMRRRQRSIGQPQEPPTLALEPGIHLPSIDEYQRWISANEPTKDELDGQKLFARTMAYKPLISIVMPTWNTDPKLLAETVQSIQAQTYPNWELCIADGGSSSNTRSAIRKLKGDDARIGVEFLETNGGISANTNAAMKMARGDFIAFLDHTDLLAPDALFEVARILNRDPGLDCVYSDSDLLSEDGSYRFNPIFTPEWSPEMLLSTNYMIHFLVVRRRLIESAGHLRSDFDGAQDWDLLLRVTEQTDNVGRIPKVLYHWRTDTGSSALSLAPKPYAEEAQRAAVQQHLDRVGLDGRVERTGKGNLRVRWSLDPKTKISIIIPTLSPGPMLQRNLAGIARSSHKNHELIVVDTGGRKEGKEERYAALAQGMDLKLLWWHKPFNYSAVNNLAAKEASGDLLLFLNDDTEPLEPDWLSELVGWAVRDGVGAVGAQLTDADGRIQHGGVILGMGGFADHLFRQMRPGDWTLLGSTDWYRNVTAVTGACLMIRRELFEEVGGWDQNFVLCGSDIELGIRLKRLGYRNVVTPFAKVLHDESSSRGPTVPEEDYFVSFWHYMPYLFKGDPYFNPGLSYVNAMPSLSSPNETRSIETVSGIIGRQLTPSTPSNSRSDSTAFAQWFQVNESQIADVAALHGQTSGRHEVTSINWFIPDFESPFYGGIHTIFRFADHFKRQYGVKSRFVVLGTGPEQYIRSGLKVSFPELADSDILITGTSDEDLAAIPPADASVATLWVTAYALARVKNTRRKFYLIQDFEPGFYAAGTTYALAEQTYRMGFYGICNTSTLANIYVNDYQGKAFGFEPCLDTSLFYPAERASDPDRPYKVFLYGRPGHERNCYEIAAGALLRLKERFQDQVRIVTAGSWASSGASEDYLDHLGLLDYKETADLYRSCDIGLVLSVSKHPSYLPMQLMASGCLVVSNVNPSGKWILRSEENCLLAPPTVESVFLALERGLTDVALRTRLTHQALEDIRRGHSDWTPIMDDIYGYLCNPEGSEGFASTTLK